MSFCHRQRLEEQCGSLENEVERLRSREADLEGELSVVGTELERVSGLLSTRSTTVEEAETKFAREIDRLHEIATHEEQTLRLEASVLRTSLEEAREDLQEACRER